MRTKSLLLSLVMSAATISASAYDWNGYTSFYPSPDDVIEEASYLETISIMYPKDPKIEVSANASATLTNKETNVSVTSTSFEFNQMAYDFMEACGVTISLPAITEDGIYELKIPAGVMTAAGESNPEMTFTYTFKDPNNVDYGTLELISVNPAEGTALSNVGLPDGDGTRTYTINTNLNDKIGFCFADWYDVTGLNDFKNLSDADLLNGYLCGTDYTHYDYYENKIPDTPLEILKYGNPDQYKMYEGHKYMMRVKCYNRQQEPRKLIGTINVEYAGTQEPYIYADAQFVAVSPDPNTYLIESVEEGKFSVAFSAPVEIDEDLSVIPTGIAMNTKYESITPNEDKTEYTFVIPEDVLKEFSIVTCNVIAVDSEGRRVAPDENMAQYRNGEEENTGCMFSYESALKGVEFSVSPAPGTVTELKEFTITADGQEIALNWTGRPILYKLQEQVYAFDLDNDLKAANDKWTEWTLTMPDAVTEPGRYILSFPSATFTIGGDYGEINKAMHFVYEIEGSDVPGDAVYDIEVESVTPAEGEVTELKDFSIIFPEGPMYGNVLWDAYILDADGNEVAKADITYDWDLFNLFFVNFSEAVNTPGTYTFYIPAGSIGDETFADSMGQSGHGNKAIRMQYAVIDNSVDFVIAEGETVNVYNIAGVCVLRNATAADIKALDKGLYIVSGNKIIVK